MHATANGCYRVPNIEIENTLFHIDDVLHERGLEVQARFGHRPNRLAELKHQRLLRLGDRVNRTHPQQHGDQANPS